MTSYVVLDTFQEIKKIPSIGSNEGLEGVHLNPPTPQRNDKGTIGVSTLQTAAAIGVATLSTIAAIAIANKQYKVAKRYWELARERFDYFQTVYRPIEEQELLELSLDKQKKVEYSTPDTTIHDKIMYKTAKRLKSLLITNCLSMGAGMLRDVNTYEALSKANHQNYILRRREAQNQADNDLFFNRQVASVSRGRDLVANSVTYADMALKSYRGQTENLNTAVQGASKFLGEAFGLNNYTLSNNASSNGDMNRARTATPTTFSNIQQPIVSNGYSLMDTLQGGWGYGSQTPENYSNEGYGSNPTLS